MGEPVTALHLKAAKALQAAGPLPSRCACISTDEMSGTTAIVFAGDVPIEAVVELLQQHTDRMRSLAPVGSC